MSPGSHLIARTHLPLAPFVLLVLLALVLQAGCGLGSPGEVLVVVNAESPISVAIGEHYAKTRRIPEANLVALHIPLEYPTLIESRHETISRDDFDRLIRSPLETFLKERGWIDRIEIIVTTKGVPLIIDAAEVPADVLLRDSMKASVDAEISLLFSSLIGKAGIEEAANPYYDDTRRFRDFRRAQPDAALRYMVARLTGYQLDVEPPGGVPRGIRRLMEAATAPVTTDPVWLIDEDPSLGAGKDAGNLILLGPAAAALSALGLKVQREVSESFVGDVPNIQGYASWGSNAAGEPMPAAYGSIDGHKYPGVFAPRALALDLVSTNARTFTHPPRYGQSLVADLVRLGVAGSPGHVDEPTMPTVTRPHILLRRYAQGVRAVEAYYRALPYLGWMNVYVGDPLMRLDEPVATDDPPDLDGDGHANDVDNCTDVPNPRQRDTDDDGFGNLCDADVTGDGHVTTSWGQVYPLGARGDVEWIALTAKNGPYDPNHDLDGDGNVDARDVSIAQLYLFHAPGPAAR